MKPTTRPIIGIDPGIKGAVALLEPNGCLTVWDLKEFYSNDLGFNCLNENMFNNFVQQEFSRLYENAYVICEKPQIRYQDGIKTSRCVYRSDGVMAAIFRCYGFTYVGAKEWKKFFGLSENKVDSIDRAVKEFPSWKDFFVGPRGGQRDGRAEAALIALYAKRYRNIPIF